jgi:S1-C subfamily serine protease
MTHRPTRLDRITQAALVVLSAVLIALMAGAPNRSTLGEAARGSAIDEAQSLAMLERTGTTFGKVAAAVSPAVVYIEARQRGKANDVYNEEAGSGVLLRIIASKRPFVVTNFHVVVNAQKDDIDVILADSRLLHPQQIWFDRDTDLAVLDLGIDDLPAAPLTQDDNVHIGQWVLAIGSPFGLMQSVTHGIVSATNRRELGMPQSMRIKEFIQTDAAINPGSSGGPLVNLRAEVVGINTAIASHTGGSSGVGFAIPASIVRRVAGDLAKQGEVRRPYLGIEFPTSFDHDEASRKGLPAPRGALIAAVTPGAPSALAGLRVGDVILEFNRVAVDDENHLINLVSQADVGQTVPLKVWREGQSTTLSVTLVPWPKG